MKVYALGRNGFVSRAIHEAIGDPPHVRQADVFVAAPTKAAAVQVAAVRGVDVMPRSADFRIATGAAVVALYAAGLFDEPGVLVVPMSRGGDLPVARVAVGGLPEVVGTLRRNTNGYTFEESR